MSRFDYNAAQRVIERIAYEHVRSVPGDRVILANDYCTYDDTTIGLIPEMVELALSQDKIISGIVNETGCTIKEAKEIFRNIVMIAKNKFDDLFCCFEVKPYDGMPPLVGINAVYLILVDDEEIIKEYYENTL